MKICWLTRQLAGEDKAIIVTFPITFSTKVFGVWDQAQRSSLTDKVKGAISVDETQLTLSSVRMVQDTYGDHGGFCFVIGN